MKKLLFLFLLMCPGFVSAQQGNVVRTHGIGAPTGTCASFIREYLNDSNGYIYNCDLATNTWFLSGAGGTSLTGTAGSVMFFGALGTPTQDNANFFYKNTAPRWLGLGTNTPVATARFTINPGITNINFGVDPGDSEYNAVWLNGGITIADANFFSARKALDQTLYINRPTGGGIYFIENNSLTNAVVIDTGGNVGIGDLTPSTPLEVGGTVTATAFVGDGSGLTNIPRGISYCGDTSGSATAMVCTTSPSFVPSTGGVVNLVPTIDCGAAPTLAVNGGAARAIYKKGGTTAAVAGDCKAGKPLVLVYDAANRWDIPDSGNNLYAADVASYSSPVDYAPALYRAAATPVTITAASAGTSGQVFTSNGAAAAGTYQALLNSQLPSAVRRGGFGGSFGSTDSGAAVLVTGLVRYAVVPYKCTIDQIDILISPADTATFRTWKVATGTAIPTVANVISTAGIGISTGTALHSTTVSDFTTTAVAANDLVAVTITAVGGTATFASYTVGCLKID